MTLQRYKAGLERYFEKRGFTPSEATAREYETPGDKYEAWIHETLLWSIARVEAGEVKEAFRGLLQAREYRGAKGGFWPNPMVSDCAIELQNEIERVLGEKGGSR